MRRIVFTVVPEGIAEKYGSIPHRVVGGVMLAYRFIDGSGIPSSVISEAQAMELGFSEEQLYGIAETNMRRYQPLIHEHDGIFSVSCVHPVVDPGMGVTSRALSRVLARTRAERIFVHVGEDGVTASASFVKLVSSVKGKKSMCGRILCYTGEGIAAA